MEGGCCDLLSRIARHHSGQRVPFNWNRSLGQRERGCGEAGHEQVLQVLAGYRIPHATGRSFC